MATRRAFLLGGLSIPALAGTDILERGIYTTTGRVKSSAPRSARSFITHMLFETRASEAQRFAQVFRRTDVGVHGLQSDVANFWYMKTRYGSEKKRPANLNAIAGMTLPMSAFCLGIAGRDLRMTMALRIDHRQGTAGSVQHTVFGPETVVAKIATRLAEQARGWPEALGTVVEGLRGGDFRGNSVTCELATPAEASGSTEHLTTWVLAPVGRELRSMES